MLHSFFFLCAYQWAKHKTISTSTAAENRNAKTEKKIQTKKPKENWKKSATKWLNALTRFGVHFEVSAPILRFALLCDSLCVCVFVCFSVFRFYLIESMHEKNNSAVHDVNRPYQSANDQRMPQDRENGYEQFTTPKSCNAQLPLWTVGAHAQTH